MFRFGRSSRLTCRRRLPGPAPVNLTVTYQRIDGSGAASAWTASNLSDSMADLFFSPTTEIGLSLLRVQLKPEGITTELQTATKAVASD